MKKILSLVLAAVMVVTMFAGLQISSSAETSASSLSQGDTFTMGQWPQSEIKDSSLISTLNALPVELYSYGYKCNAIDENTYDIVDMSFGDVAYGGEVYRKVVINQYRPTFTSAPFLSDYSLQDSNGYTTDNTYWFRWEPIKWCVLANEIDGVYVFSYSILDSQPYNDIYKSTTWEECTIRAWLSQDFYQSAFSANEKSKVLNYYHQNENSPWNSPASGDPDTTDNIWLPSYSDIVNSAYDFSSSASDDDTVLRARGTDYAKSQGLKAPSLAAEPYEDSSWWLRSLAYNSTYATCVLGDVYAYSNSQVYNTNYGVRPAFKLRFSSSISSAEPAEVDRIFHNENPTHIHSYKPVITAQKANAVGYTQYKCSCGEWQKDESGKIIKDNFTAPTGKPTGLKCAARTATAEKFTWFKTAGVSGHEVQISNAAGNKWGRTYNAKTAITYTFSKLKAGSNYKFRVRFYITVDGHNYYGAWSTISSPTLPKATKVTSAIAAKKAFTAKWTKAAGVTGYQVQYATNAKFTKATTKTVKGATKASLAVKSLKGNTKYYVRVRTYKTIGGKNYFSTWSGAKAVKTK